MRVDKIKKAVSAVADDDLQECDLAWQADRFLDTHPAATPQLPYYADSIWRRPKTDAELIRDLEFVALAERRRR